MLNRRVCHIGLVDSHDLITSPAYIVIKAINEFKDKTTRPKEVWQNDFTSLKVGGWGWIYLSTILDDCSRYITALGCNSVKVEHRRACCPTTARVTSPPIPANG